MDDLRRGQASPDDLDQYIEAWHQGAGADALREALGMTEREYGDWFRTGELPAVEAVDE